MQTKEQKRKYYEEHREEILAKMKKYREENHDEILRKAREAFANRTEEQKEKRRKYKKSYDEKHKQEILETEKARYQQQQDQKLAHQKEYYENNKEKVLEYHKEYRNRPATYKKYYEKFKHYYNDDEMRQDPENPKLIQFRCHFNGCREWFNPTMGKLDMRYESIMGRTTATNELYCSDECKEKCDVFGRHKYQKSLSPRRLSREAQPELRKLVLERDNYTCQREECHKSKAEFSDLVLHCHHIFPLNEDPVCFADIDNCITLCEECHRWVHLNIPGCSYAELRCSKKEDYETPEQDASQEAV